jgi:GNAT superfamily N-acetyltransferase
MDNQSQWLLCIQEATASKLGHFLTNDIAGTQVILEWERIDAQSPRLSEKIKNLHEILIETYTHQELQFAQKHPEAVPHEHFLKPLAPLFKDGIEKVNWNLATQQMRGIFKHFFTATDFAKFSAPNEIHIFVVAKDKETGEPLGLIQFLITPEYAYGNVKVALYGITPTEQDRGLAKLLMSSIFELIPDVTRIFLHTRITNENSLSAYRDWGFTHTPGPLLAHWVDLEYLREKSSPLQKIAQTFYR